MKILQLGKAYPPANLGGVEVVIKLLTEGLNDVGIETDALGVNDRNKLIVEKYKVGKIFRSSLLVKLFSTLISFELITILKKIWRDYDVITIHAPDPMACLALWLINPTNKVVLFWHSDILRQKKLLLLYKPLQEWLLKRSDKIVCTSPNYMMGSPYLKPYLQKCEVIPIGVNVDAHCHTEVNINEKFTKFSNKQIIFSLGRLAYYKGFEYLVLSALHLNDDSVILIAGDGEEKEKLSDLILSNGLQNKVFLLGRISDAEKEYLFENAKIFALSSIFKTEAFAIVQIEALANGLPVISTKIPGSGVDWVNQNGVTGLTVPVQDSLAIANAINELLNNTEFYHNCSEKARLRYKTHFTRDAMINSFINLYNILV